MLGVTCLANNYVRIGIKYRIIKNRLRFYRTGIDLSNVADSGQLIDPLSVGIVSIITGKLLAKYKTQSVLFIPLMQTTGVLHTINHLREVSISIPVEL